MCMKHNFFGILKPVNKIVLEYFSRNLLLQNLRQNSPIDFKIMLIINWNNVRTNIIFRGHIDIYKKL